MSVESFVAGEMSFFVTVRDGLAIGKFGKIPERPIHSRPNRPVVMLFFIFIFISGVSINTAVAWASLGPHSCRQHRAERCLPDWPNLI